MWVLYEWFLISNVSPSHTAVALIEVVVALGPLLAVAAVLGWLVGEPGEQGK